MDDDWAKQLEEQEIQVAKKQLEEQEIQVAKKVCRNRHSDEQNGTPTMLFEWNIVSMYTPVCVNPLLFFSSFSCCFCVCLAFIHTHNHSQMESLEVKEPSKPQAPSSATSPPPPAAVATAAASKVEETSGM